MFHALEVEDLSISFGKTRGSRDLTLHVEAGDSFAIVGPNGSGETVLIKAPTAGVDESGQE